MVGLDAVGIFTAAAAAEHDFHLVSKALGFLEVPLRHGMLVEVMCPDRTRHNPASVASTWARNGISVDAKNR
jgi:hypothetical protein